jgi:hypothetical protein
MGVAEVLVPSKFIFLITHLLITIVILNAKVIKNYLQLIVSKKIYLHQLVQTLQRLQTNIKMLNLGIESSLKTLTL